MVPVLRDQTLVVPYDDANKNSELGLKRSCRKAPRSTCILTSNTVLTDHLLYWSRERDATTTLPPISAEATYSPSSLKAMTSTVMQLRDLHKVLMDPLSRLN